MILPLPRIARTLTRARSANGAFFSYATRFAKSVTVIRARVGRQSPGSALNELACLASIQHAARTAVEASSEFVAKLAPPASPGAGTSSAASTPVPASPSDGVTTANEPTGDAIV